MMLFLADTNQDREVVDREVDSTENRDAFELRSIYFYAPVTERALRMKMKSFPNNGDTCQDEWRD